MVRTALPLAVIAATAASAHADDRPTLTGGPVVALHATGLSGDATLDVVGNETDASPRQRDRFGVGGFVAVAVTDAVDVRVEVLYSQRGAVSAGAAPFGDSARYSVKYTVDAIAVPVLAAYHIAYDDEFTPRLLGGVEVVVPLDTTLETDASFATADGMPVEFDDSFDLSDDTTSVDIAAVIGVGMGFPIAGRSLVVDLRYALGVTSAISAHEVTPLQGATYTTDTLRSRTFSVSASFEL